jgi:hypothetical protein
MHLGLPLQEKRRLYDVIEVLNCAGLVSIRKEARKRYFNWKPQKSMTTQETMDMDMAPDPLFQEAGTILHLLLHLNPGAFQELSNDSAVKMLERDVKRTIWGANAVSVVRVSLQDKVGRILKENSTGEAHAAAY